ncbi:hypothetical protein [Streptomyces sp. NPDC006368]|uniref:hypothetical protein n=1 Tax=Streptomyces sp. NPDC006368 TaxID=3156760 RepID=UPI0033A6FA3F
MVRGAWWRVFGITLLTWLMAVVAGYVVRLPFSLLNLLPGPALSTGEADSGTALALVVTLLAFTLLAQLIGQILTAARSS